MLPYWEKMTDPASGCEIPSELDGAIALRLVPVSDPGQQAVKVPGPVATAAVVGTWSYHPPQSDPGRSPYPMQAPGVRCCIFLQLKRGAAVEATKNPGPKTRS